MIIVKQLRNKQILIYNHEILFNNKGEYDAFMKSCLKQKEIPKDKLEFIKELFEEAMQQRLEDVKIDKYDRHIEACDFIVKFACDSVYQKMNYNDCWHKLSKDSIQRYFINYCKELIKHHELKGINMTDDQIITIFINLNEKSIKEFENNKFDDNKFIEFYKDYVKTKETKNEQG